MYTKKRSDGTYIKNMHFFNKIMPYLMPTRTEACIYYDQEFDVTRTIEYVRERIKKSVKAEKNEGVPRDKNKISVFIIMLYAAMRSIAQRPKMNRFISGYRYYQRNRIMFNFVAKRDLSDEGEEVNVTMSFSPLLSLEEFAKKINDYLRPIKKGSQTGTEKTNAFLSNMPRFLLKFIFKFFRYLDYHNGLPKSVLDSFPFYCTMFFTNVGSVGIDAPYHHNFEIGNCGIFCAIGKTRRENHLNEDGTFEKRDKIKITFTFDDRITDGIYCARAIDMMRDLVENPEKLELPLKLTEEQIAELCLSAN